MTTRKVIIIGTSVGVTIPKSYLEARKIRPGDILQVSESGSGILIEPLRKKADRRGKVTDLALDFVDRYREDLDALADK